jgi:hypothetical protein
MRNSGSVEIAGILRLGGGVLIFLTVIILMGCKGGGERVFNNKESLEEISGEMIEILQNKRILFGHKSVGYNILEGVEEIRKRDGRFKEMNVKELKEDPGELTEGGFYHLQNGKNGFPKDKCDAFRKLLIEKGMGNRVDIAFFKFCYVDFQTDSNVQDIFDYYVKTIDSVRAGFPKLKIIHVTVPLTAHTWGAKSYVRNLLKGDLTNVRRNEFNRFLINKYKDKDPIYDLALAESTQPDGKRESFKHNGEEFFALAKQYSTDGGHLNELGSFCAAKELLLVLSQAASS